MYNFSEKSLNVLKNVDEQLQLLFKESIKVSPIDFGIPSTGGNRSIEEQYSLYLDGKSKCDGYKKKSYHQTGKAVDFYAFINGKASWDKIHLALVASVIMTVANQLNINIRWGGTFNSNVFKGWDYPHIELK
jgi:peptidoglycan L-alanyl-D-glutamate endopeptidase CwlK